MRFASRVAILMYHSIARSPAAAPRELTVDPALFDEQLAALREAGARLVRVDEVPAILADPALHGDDRPTVAVTIDDGLADLTGALPVLTRHDAPATLFVPTSWVGSTAGWLPGADGRRAMLSWPGVLELADAGMEIGSHGHRHIACDVNDLDLVRSDARRSRAELEDRLGRPARSFAFPFGYGPPSARQAIRLAGFAQACVIADLPAETGDDRFSLPRLHVGPQITPAALLDLVRHHPTPIARRWSRAKQRVWTAGRRHAGWGPSEAGVMTTLTAVAR